MGTALEPVVDLRVVGTDEDGGMNRSSLEWDIRYNVREYTILNLREMDDDEP